MIAGVTTPDWRRVSDSRSRTSRRPIVFRITEFIMTPTPTRWCSTRRIRKPWQRAWRGLSRFRQVTWPP